MSTPDIHAGPVPDSELDWLLDQPGDRHRDYPPAIDGLPRPIVWNTLTPDALHDAWHALDQWVTWLRHTYALPATIIPPAWHRHPELHWELSALHLHWLSSYHPDQHASAPLSWHRDLTDTLGRLRDWTAASGTGLDIDRRTRQTPWPGERHEDTTVDRPLTDRLADFHDHVTQQVTDRQTHHDTEALTAQ